MLSIWKWDFSTNLFRKLKSITGRKVPPFLGARNKRLNKPSLMGGGGGGADFCNSPLGEEVLHLWIYEIGIYLFGTCNWNGKLNWFATQRNFITWNNTDWGCLGRRLFPSNCLWMSRFFCLLFGGTKGTPVFWTFVVLRVGASKGFSLLGGLDDPERGRLAGREAAPKFFARPLERSACFDAILGSRPRKAFA